MREVFVTGNPKDTTVYNKLQEESDKYRDLIVGDFVDVYKNLTIKEATALRWIHSYCLSANFVVKLDDDVLIKPWLLLETVEKFSTSMNQQRFDFRKSVFTDVFFLNDFLS